MSDDYLPLEPSPETVALLALGWIRRGDAVLDLGCFQGDDAVYLQTAGCDVLGVDMSPTAIAYARGLARHICRPKSQPEFRVGTVPACLRRLRKASYAVVLDRLLLSNLSVHDQRACLRELRRVLRPDGIFVLRAGMSTSGPLDARTRQPIDARRVREAGFRAVRWRRDASAESERTTRGRPMYLSPTRAGFHDEAWFELFELSPDRSGEARRGTGGHR